MLTRRLFLKSAGLIGCSAAAHPLLTTMTFAAMPGENRLVVIVLRGAMDGLDVLRPVGDPFYAGLRPRLSLGPAATVLDGGFHALHPALAPLLPLWRAGQLGFAQAVSTPYRDKRSHFDGQDVLEAGTGGDVPAGAAREGWLNRLVQTLPGARAETAFSVGIEEMLILSGRAPVMSWAPESQLSLSPQARLLLEHVYHDDPLFREAGAAAMEIGAAMDAGMAAGGTEDAAGMGEMTGMDDMVAAPPAAITVPAGPATGPATEPLAEFAAGKLRGETRIASYSLGGWDTHRGQAVALTKALDRLAASVLTLRAGLGPVWDRTTVLAMTEFGRTARENGSAGTDHGTGGTMLIAGGAVRGGRVLGDWPGLAEADLYDRRDLMPTGDVRAFAGWAMRGLYGTPADVVERSVFPGLRLGADPGLLL